MALTRVEHWATRSFHEFLIARAPEPFVWGKNDCALFVADGIQSLTGVDIAPDFRGKYTTEEEAFQLIEAVTGGKTVEDAAAWCAARYGLEEWACPLGAQRGDMVVLMDADRLISGLVHLNGRDIVAVGEEGLKRIPLTAVTRAWHV
jgi:hypothetical protein